MGILAAGQVVIVHFPFSDLSQSKLCPAVVLAEAGRGDWLLYPITSKSYGDPRAIQIVAADFVQGSLSATSYVRPGKLFTAHASLVAGQIGELHAASFAVIRDTVVRLASAFAALPPSRPPSSDFGATSCFGAVSRCNRPFDSARGLAHPKTLRASRSSSEIASAS